MSLGPGKWDHLCTYVREQSKAEAAVLILLDMQVERAGFSVQAPLPWLRTLPNMLRDLAQDIESDLKRRKL